MHCKDFVIFKVKTAPSRYMMKKFFNHEQVGILAFYKFIDEFRKFELAFFNHVTGLSEQYMWDNHRFFMEECRKEILKDYGIIQSKLDTATRFLIPKDNLELIEWFKANCQLEFSILKKIRIFFLFHKKSTHWRDLSEEHNLRLGRAPKIKVE